MGLREMFDRAPKAFTFMKEMYFHQSNQFYFSGSEIKIIQSMVGFHQGDVLGTWAFMIAIQPLLDELHEFLVEQCQEHNRPPEDSQFRIFFYADDGYIIGSEFVVQKAISFLKQNGKLFGYHIKPTKGALLLGKRDSARGTGHSYNSYKNLELNESMIHVHPRRFCTNQRRAPGT